MIGIRVAGVDPDGFDRIDRALNLADLWPACGMQQQFSAGIDTGQCGASFVTPHSPHNIDVRGDRPEVVRRPAHQRENRAWLERRRCVSGG